MRVTPVFVLALTAAAAAQGLNPKILYSNQTTASVRDRTSATDRLYYMQHAAGRTGHGRATGFRGVLQDQNQATSETIRLAFVRYAADKIHPDVTSNGVVVEATYSIFGTGTGVAAYLFTFTLPRATAVPATLGIRATLPPPASWPSDGASIHYQNGNQLRLPARVAKPQLTWRLAGTAQAFAPAGSTLRLGGLYEEGVTQAFISSTAYGPRADLNGIEALWPDGGRGDHIGWSITHDGFKSKVAVLIIGPGYAATPLPTPFGTVFVRLAGTIFIPAVALDKNGTFKTVSLAPPKNLVLAAQSILVDPVGPRVRLTDATLSRTQ